MPEKPRSNGGRQIGRDGPEPAIYEPRFGEPPAPDLSEGTTMKTGTTLVSLTTAEGVLVATDRRASAGGRFVLSKNARKVEQVHPTAASPSRER